jgi:hypothetical protein
MRPQCGLPSGLVVLLNLRGIKDGIAEVVFAEFPARKLPASAPN